MGIITFFGVFVTLKLSSPIFKACLLKKGGIGVAIEARTPGEPATLCRTTTYSSADEPRATTYPGCDIMSRRCILCCILATSTTYPGCDNLSH
jgi:hypothetical protein